NSPTTLVKPLNDSDRKIAELTPPGFPGSDRIKVKFQVDEERFLKITVEDLLTNSTLVENQIVAQIN
ncbi:MAG: Hsp70 family protein, partial [Cylindrospermopsis raciborskii 1523720]|nr:Hsp70 family protein [Cylindrospermopsis raciborskii]